MQEIEVKKQSGWGGARPGSGRPRRVAAPDAPEATVPAVIGALIAADATADATGDEAPEPVAVAAASTPEPVTVSGDETPDQLAALIRQLNEHHHKVTEQTEAEFKRTITDLLERQRQAEIRAAEQVDLAVGRRLREASAGIKAAEARWEDPTADVAEATVERCRKRCAPNLAKARAAKRDLDAFVKEYGALLEELGSKSYDDLMRGMPLQGHDRAASPSVCARVVQTVQNIRTLIDVSFATIARETRNVERLIEEAASAREQEHSRELAQSLHDLATVNDSASVLNDLIRGLSGTLAGICQMKEREADRVAGGGTPSDPNSIVIRNFPEPPSMPERNQPNREWALFRE